ncbi:MAG: putative nucleic acid-binding Zn-ribbon protein [Flavobacteriales bacterium]|jgi:predicted  nucleic acid-binding Zn-ribbon protein
MAKKAVTPEDKLRALYALQTIDSKIDKIRVIRGELPLEVEDLEDEIEGLRTRVGRLNDELGEIDKAISDKKNAIEESKGLIKKYEEQQSNVRNNREFDSLSKEIEFQGLEMQLSEKKIKEFGAQKSAKQELIDASQGRLTDREEDLTAKKGELDEIVNETKLEEQILVEKSLIMKDKIEERLVIAYDRIRGAAKNGLAVVPIEREASAGSYIKIPPQKQLDVAARKKIIVDEHSGRILVDKELADEEREKMEALIAKELKKLKK